MHTFVRNLLTEWRRLEMPFSDENIVIAVSGGADSMALCSAIFDLHKRKKLKNKFIIAHFNHNLRGEESKSDAGFVQNFAKQVGFDYVEEKASEKPKKKDNIEQWARENRYKFLIKTANQQNAHSIITAHTINDQAETFLINLIRGSGLDGLSAMKPKSQPFDDEVLIVRPLLNWALRADTENFLYENEIKFIDDAMNEDLTYKRVKVRKKLIPFLKEFNPNIVKTLANTSKTISADNELFNDLIYEKLDKEKLIDGDHITIKNLKNLSKPMRYRVLRSWIKKRKGNLRQIGLNHIESIIKLVESRKSGKIVELPEFIIIKKEKGRLFFQDTKVEK